MNVHAPERQPGESQAEYRERRALSKRINRNLRVVGAGNQRKEPSSREQLRDAMRKNGKLRSGAFGQGLLNAWDRMRERAARKKHPLRDEHGSFTKTGRDHTVDIPDTGWDDWKWKAPRRLWLAGISAQRGY